MSVKSKNWKLVDSGVSYCVAHHGLVDVDENRCDNRRAHNLRDPNPPTGRCELRKLYYKERKIR